MTLNLTKDYGDLVTATVNLTVASTVYSTIETATNASKSKVTSGVKHDESSKRGQACMFRNYLSVE